LVRARTAGRCVFQGWISSAGGAARLAFFCRNLQTTRQLKASNQRPAQRSLSCRLSHAGVPLSRLHVSKPNADLFGMVVSWLVSSVLVWLWDMRTDSDEQFEILKLQDGSSNVLHVASCPRGQFGTPSLAPTRRRPRSFVVCHAFLPARHAGVAVPTPPCWKAISVHSILTRSFLVPFSGGRTAEAWDALARCSRSIFAVILLARRALRQACRHKGAQAAFIRATDGSHLCSGPRFKWHTFKSGFELSAGQHSYRFGSRDPVMSRQCLIQIRVQRAAPGGPFNRCGSQATGVQL